MWFDTQKTFYLKWSETRAIEKHGGERREKIIQTERQREREIHCVFFLLSEQEDKCFCSVLNYFWLLRPHIHTKNGIENRYVAIVDVPYFFVLTFRAAPRYEQQQQQQQKWDTLDDISDMLLFGAWVLSTDTNMCTHCIHLKLRIFVSIVYG